MSSTQVIVFQAEVETVTEFLQRFKVQNSSALDAADDGKRAELLCRALPVAIITDVQRRIKPTLLENATYQEIEDSLKAQYSVKKSVIGASVKFINRKQQSGETIETYAKILNDLASCCSYNDCCRDRLLRDAFVSGLSSNKLISNLLHECENKSFNECVERAKTLEQLAHDAADMKPEEKSVAYKINNYNNKNSSPKVSDDYICIRCGSAGKHRADKCFALKLKCNKCSKKGHLSKVCKSKVSRVNTLAEGGDNEPAGESELRGNFPAQGRHLSLSSEGHNHAHGQTCCNGAVRHCNSTTNNTTVGDNFLW